MKFRIPKESLLEGLQKVQNVVSTRQSLPILANVLLVAKNGRLHMSTTDLDMGITGSVEANVEKEGATTLPARRLAAIVRDLPASEVEVTVDSKDVATIFSGPSKFKILGLNRAEFPPLADFSSSKQFHIPQQMLLDSFKKTSYAISTDETRYVLNGTYLMFREGKMTVVATDGRRLAMVEHDLEFPASHEMEIIVPSKTVSEVTRLLGDDGEVIVSLQGNQISFKVGDTLLISKLIEGTYPNFRKVIPGECRERITLPREAFLETVSRVSLLFGSEKSNSIKLKFSANQLEVNANSTQFGEAQESMDVMYTGNDMQIAFNPDLLRAPLNHLGTESIYLDLIDEMSPGVIRIDGSFLYVIMPMRVTV